MHIPDGLVDVPTSVAGGVVAAGSVAVAGRRAAARLKEKATTLPAVVAAYLLVGQLLVIPLGFGSSAHLIGTGLAVALVGPAITIVCVATVVVLQALVLADGGVTAIGLNIVNDGVVPALVAYGVLRLAAPVVARNRSRAPAVAGIAAAIAALAAGLAAATELAIGGSDVVSARAVFATLAGSHLIVAAIEGALTAAIVTVIQGLRPDYLAIPGLERIASAPTGAGHGSDPSIGSGRPPATDPRPGAAVTPAPRPAAAGGPPSAATTGPGQTTGRADPGPDGRGPAARPTGTTDHPTATNGHSANRPASARTAGPAAADREAQP